MYFTIWADPESSPQLSPDAEAAFQRLRGHAFVLAALSTDCARAARTVTDRYRAALAAGRPEPWQPFVSAVSSLLRHSADAFPTLAPGARQHAADGFFDQIVRENADLLDAETPALV